MSLQAELEQVAHNLSGNLREASNEDDYADSISEALKAILATVSKHLPEKRTAMMVTHCPYCSRNFPTVEEEYNTAITEMENLLGGNDE